MNTVAAVRSTDNYQNLIARLAGLQSSIDDALAMNTELSEARAHRIADRRDHMVEGAALALGIPGLYINEDLTAEIVEMRG